MLQSTEETCDIQLFLSDGKGARAIVFFFTTL